MDAFFFWLFSAGMIVAGLAVVLNRNPVASALCFALSIVFMSGLFVLLSAFFLAAVQILVTAGAVMVLFLFIIMLLNPEQLEHVPLSKMGMALSALLALGFIFLVAHTLHDMPFGQTTISSLSAPIPLVADQPDFAAAQAAGDHHDDTHRIGRLLFSTYVAPFEITSLLILVATIGVIVLCKQEDRNSGESSPSAPFVPARREHEMASTR